MPRKPPAREPGAPLFGAFAEQTPLESLIADLDVSAPAQALIAKRAAEMPPTQRRAYVRAMAGRSPRMAIRSMCRMCVSYVRREIELCTDPACPLYPLRMPRKRRRTQ